MSSIYEVFDKVLYILQTGIGRDKCCRIIQYTIMGLIPTLQSRGQHLADLVSRLNKLKSGMSQTRKVLRFGKEFPLISGIKKRLLDHEASPQRMIFWKTVSDISLILYFATDHPLYFNQIGFKSYKKEYLQRLDFWNNIFWLVNSLLDIAITVVDMKYLQEDIDLIKSKLKLVEKAEKSEKTKLETEDLKKQLRTKTIAYVKCCLNVARNAFDIPVIFYFLDSPRVSQTTAGFLGALTSLISLYGMWGQKF